MQLTIDVPDEIAAKAAALGVAPDSYAAQLVNRGLAVAQPTRDLASVQAAVDRIRELRG